MHVFYKYKYKLRFIPPSISVQQYTIMLKCMPTPAWDEYEYCLGYYFHVGYLKKRTMHIQLLLYIYEFFKLFYSIQRTVFSSSIFNNLTMSCFCILLITSRTSIC